MRDKPAVMLFAAGRGTRMAPLTDDRPKPLVEVAGRPLIDHALDLVRGAGLHRIVANTHYLPEQLERHLRLANVQTVRENVLLETGGGLRNALSLLGADPVITLNSDAVWSKGNPVTALLNAWKPDRMDALLTLIHPDKAIGHEGPGDFLKDGNGRLSRGPSLVYSGLQILKTDRLSQFGEDAFSLNRVWDMMADDGRLFGLQTDCMWCDVGRPENISLAEAILNV